MKYYLTKLPCFGIEDTYIKWFKKLSTHDNNKETIKIIVNQLLGATRFYIMSAPLLTLCQRPPQCNKHFADNYVCSRYKIIPLSQNYFSFSVSYIYLPFLINTML